jgi:hypothetical protein
MGRLLWPYSKMLDWTEKTYQRQAHKLILSQVANTKTRFKQFATHIHWQEAGA